MSKSWEALENVPIDIVITVCGQATGETCPAYLGKALRVQRGLPDPAGVSGSEEAVEAAFQAIYDALKRRVERLERLKQQLLQSGAVRVDTEIVYGSPTAIILEYARKQAFSLILMGAQGRGFISEIFQGSVAHNIARLAPLLVLFIPTLR